MRKGWLLSRAQEVVAPVYYTGETTQTPTGVSEDQPNPPQVDQVGIAVTTLCSQPGPISFCHLSYIPSSPFPPREGAAAVLPRAGKTVRKALQPRSILTGKKGAPFLLSQDLCSLQGGKALAEGQELGNGSAPAWVFKRL